MNHFPSQVWQTLRRYVPFRPWQKQMRFLELDCLEALYGGAAAGGKSQALLMAALQFVHVPGYSALILRKDTRRLSLSGGLIPRSQEWLVDKDATWSASKNQWTFPTQGEPATISFGYLGDSIDKFRYGSSEYQFIAFDELTEFPEEDYLFLFSRLRKRRDVDAPLRMRSASNPGGKGHHWVKRRFVPDRAAEIGLDLHWRNDSAFLRASIRDNPGIGAEQYEQSLGYLPPVLRKRMLEGDWSTGERAIVQEDWLRYYTQDDKLLRLYSAKDKPLADLDERDLYRFMTIDPAGTEARSANSARRSASAIQIWERSYNTSVPYLVLREAYHESLSFGELCRRIEFLAKKEPISKSVHIENEKFGVAAFESLKDLVPIELVKTGGDNKLKRAIPLIDKLKRGEVFLPTAKTDGVTQFISELLEYTGENDAHCDQIDAAAYAALLSPTLSGPLTIMRVLIT
jgi:hypothetical protein